MSLPGRGAAAASGRASGSRKRDRDTDDEFSEVRRSLQAMETTFVTIHDLTYDANILYSSTSITDVLDWKPEDVVGKSCWDYFHPDEVPFAKAIHGRGVELDKASVLNYCRIKNKHGDWVGCECVFTVVYNVLVGCISVYMDGPKAKKRAVEAPVVRQLFSSSPRDPRYHMLQYISSKFASGPRPHLHEPRAALFLNRFTRTLTINFATNGLENLLGISAAGLTGQSFYYCIQENCLSEAIRCLESAKANDSIAYLRFWFRNPLEDGASQHDERIDEADGSSSDDDGGVQIAPRIEVDRDRSPPEQAITSGESSAPPSTTSGTNSGDNGLVPGMPNDDSRHSSGHSTDIGQDASGVMFDRQSPAQRASTPRSMMSLDSPELRTPPRPSNGRSEPQRSGQDQRLQPRRSVELEAVVSCTSDGLVVIMRAARPFVPDSVRVPPKRAFSPYSNGLFASPWATHPVMPNLSSLPSNIPTSSAQAKSVAAPPITAATAAAPPVEGPRPATTVQPATAASGPPLIDFMNSIRDVAVFAWALTGINGSLQQYGKGTPLVGSIPHTGLPIWDPDGKLAEKEKRDKEARMREAEDGGVITKDDGQQAPHDGTSNATVETRQDDEHAEAKEDVAFRGHPSSHSVTEQIGTANKTPEVKESAIERDDCHAAR